MPRKKKKDTVDKRTADYKESKLEHIIRITTSYLVEVDKKDLDNIKKYSLDNFILNDLRSKRKFVELGKSNMRKTTGAVWHTEEKKQEKDLENG